jgi:GH18 family chitinase
VQENDIQNKNDVLQADYVKANGLGGSMVWAMDLDDYKLYSYLPMAVFEWKAD